MSDQLFRVDDKTAASRLPRPRWATGVVALASGMLFAVGAQADIITLPDAVVFGAASLGIAANEVVLRAPGSISLPAPFNYGTATLVAQTIPHPAISLTMSFGMFESTGGGTGEVHLTYDVMYYDPGAAVGATILATVSTSDILTQTGNSAATAELRVGGAVLGYECVANGSNCGGAPFVSGPIIMTENQAYLVQLDIGANGFFDTVTNTNSLAFASIDPTFTAAASGGGQFIFSAGIGNADVPTDVPEPPAWAMLISFAGIGFGAYRLTAKATLLSHD